MVLLNFRIKNNVGLQRIKTTVQNPFPCGRYKVKVVFTDAYFQGDSSYMGYWRVDSNELINSHRTNGGYGFYLLPHSFTGLTLDKQSYGDMYEWEVYLSSCTISVELYPAIYPPNGPPISLQNFQHFFISYDFTPIL